MDWYLQKCLTHLRRPYANFHWLHIHPYKWPSDSKFPAENENWLARLHWRLNFATVISYFCFVVYRAVQVNLDPHASFTRKFYMVLIVMFYSWAAISHTAVFITRSELVPFLKNYLKFLEDGKHFKAFWLKVTFKQLIWNSPGHEFFKIGETARRNVSRANTCKWLMAMNCYSTWFDYVVIPVVNITQPTSPEFLSSLIMDNSSSGLVQIVGVFFSSIFQLNLMLCLGQGFNLVFGPMILFMFSMSEFIQRQTYVIKR